MWGFECGSFFALYFFFIFPQYGRLDEKRWQGRGQGPWHTFRVPQYLVGRR